MEKQQREVCKKLLIRIAVSFVLFIVAVAVFGTLLGKVSIFDWIVVGMWVLWGIIVICPFAFIAIMAIRYYMWARDTFDDAPAKTWKRLFPRSKIKLKSEETGGYVGKVVHLFHHNR